MLVLAVSPLQAAPVTGMGTWQQTLQARDIDGDGTADAYYDTTLKITWLADGNAGAGSGFDATHGGGLMTWAEATAWAAALSVHGTTGWRLPWMVDTGALGCDQANSGTDCGWNVQTVSPDGLTVYSEWAHLFHVTLGNLAWSDPSGDYAAGNASSFPDYMLVNTGPFSNLKSWAYWFGVAYGPSPQADAWRFHTDTGDQNTDDQGHGWYAMAVHDGDVAVASPVPEPPGLAGVLTALAALVLAGRPRGPRSMRVTVVDAARPASTDGPRHARQDPRPLRLVPV